MATNKVISKLSVIVGVNSGDVQTGLAGAVGHVKRFDTQVSSGATSVGGLNVALSATSTTFHQFTGFISRAALQMGGFVVATAATAASVGGLIASFNRIDEIAKLADQLGFTTQEVQAFQYGANLAGVEISALERGLQRFTLRLGQASVGSSEGLAGFEMLGLDIQKLLAMNPAAAFGEVAEAVKQLQSPADQAAAAYALFGRSGQELLTFLNSGKDGIAAFTAEAAKLGLTFDRDMAAKVEMANDAMTTMGTAVQGLTDQLAISLAPTIVTVAQALTSMTVTLGSVDASTVKSVVQIGVFVTTIGLVITIVPRVITAIRAVIATLRAFSVASIIAQAASGNLVGVLAAIAVGGVAAVGVGLAFDEMTKGAEGAAAAVDKIQPGSGLAELERGKQSMEEWAGIGERLTQSAKTPFELLEDSVAEASEALDRGVISLETYQRIINKPFAEAAKKEMEEWARIGERLTQSVQTPFEKMQDSVDEASEALVRGAISWETYQRVVNDALDAVERQPNMSSLNSPVGVGAAVRGTSSGFNAALSAGDASMKMYEAMKQAAERDKQRNVLLEGMRTKLVELERQIRNNPTTIREGRI